MKSRWCLRFTGHVACHEVLPGCVVPIGAGHDCLGVSAMPASSFKIRPLSASFTHMPMDTTPMVQYTMVLQGRVLTVALEQTLEEWQWMDDAATVLLSVFHLQPQRFHNLRASWT